MTEPRWVSPNGTPSGPGFPSPASSRGVTVLTYAVPGATLPSMATTTTKTRFTGFADHSPAQLRELLLPEDHEAFDASFRKALDETAGP